MKSTDPKVTLPQTIGSLKRAETILSNVLRVGYLVSTVSLVITMYDWIQKIGDFKYLIVLAVVIPGLLTFNVQRHKWELLPELKRRKIRYIRQPVPMIMFYFYFLTFYTYVVSPYLPWIAFAVSIVIHEWYYRTNQRAYHALEEPAPEK